MNTEDLNFEKVTQRKSTRVLKRKCLKKRGKLKSFARTKSPSTNPGVTRGHDTHHAAIR